MKEEQPPKQLQRGLQSTDEVATRDRMGAEGGKVKYGGLSPADGEDPAGDDKKQPATKKGRAD